MATNVNCDACVLKALRSQTKRLCLDNSGLKVFPAAVVRLDFLESLSIKNNDLLTLPEDVSKLRQLTYLNIGGNKFHTIPECVCGLTKLLTLHLFHNFVTAIPSTLPRTLVLLNLNDNLISSIPPNINQLTSLKQLSIANNKLTQLPEELCSLSTLEELHLNGNELTLLPHHLGKLINLKKLLLHKNRLKSLPPTIGKCNKLVTLDISGNQMDVFPAEIEWLSVREVYFENNPLLPYIPVPADQYQEVIPLKEAASRLLVSEIKQDNNIVSAMINYYPEIQEQLGRAGTCAVCGEAFVTLWLDCVRFVLPKRVFKKLHNSSPGYLPLKAQICSYKCFNTDGHELYGVAEPLLQ